VTVSDGTDSCTGTVAAGQCSLTFTGVGAKSLAATYAGDANFNGSSSAAAPHQVNRADTTTAITSGNPDPSGVGQAVTVQYSVSVNAPGAGAATGNVTVSDGTAGCTGTVAAGQCDITFSSAGSKSLTATYAGDSGFNGSTSATEAHTVNGSATITKADTTTTITADTPDPSVVGQAVTVRYSVSVNAPGAGTPTGNVTVSDGTGSCTGTVAAGQCTITFTSAGSKSLTATYGGDSNFNASAASSPPTVHTVNTAGPTRTTFRSFTASRVRKGVLLRWRTAAEVGTRGFNVYRGVGRTRHKLNRRLIVSRGRATGSSYTFLDRRVARRSAPKYWLQVVAANSARSWRGPVRPRPR
jgi:Bacterial Ig-like domain (group 3)